MKFDIRAPGKLTGTVKLPGDYRLTLSALAFGMISGEKVTVINPSPAFAIQNFRMFLENYGAVFSPAPDGFTIQGRPYERETVIPPEIPDEIFYGVVSSALSSSDSLRIVNGTGERAPVLEHLLDFLPKIGFGNISVSEDGGDVILTGNGFEPPPIVAVSSSREFETAAAAAFSARKPVSLRYRSPVVSHDLSLLRALGTTFGERESKNRQENELERRLARVSGDKSPEENFFTWECRPATIRIPGDTTIGAALAGAAAVSQGSEVVLARMLWEPGRRGFFDAFRRMKGDIEAKIQSHKSGESSQTQESDAGYSFETADVRIGWSRLEGIRVSPDQALTMRDELMILGSVAVSAYGETIIHEKEDEHSFRSMDFKLLKEGLLALGAHLGDFSGGMVVKGPSPELKGDLADSGGKSEIALALAVAGMNASGTTSVFGFDQGTYPLCEFLAKIDEIKENRLSV